MTEMQMVFTSIPEKILPLVKVNARAEIGGGAFSLTKREGAFSLTKEEEILSDREYLDNFPPW